MTKLTKEELIFKLAAIHYALFDVTRGLCNVWEQIDPLHKDPDVDLSATIDYKAFSAALHLISRGKHEAEEMLQSATNCNHSELMDIHFASLRKEAA